MRYFVTRKKVKVPRYYLILFFLGSMVLVIIILNLIFNKINSPNLSHVLLKNAFGINDKASANAFLKNVFGFSLQDDEPAFKENISDLINTDPLIYLYNTFQTDKYYHNYYNSYSINPVVTQGNLILQEYLKKEGINSIVETASVAKVLKERDIPYSLSYRGSRVLLEQAYNDYNSLKYFFDIQIASEEKEITTVTIDNEHYARVLFVVGCANNNYGENQKLANSLNEKMQKYPDLSRGVSLRCGTGYHGFYNQDFNSNVLLLEIGGNKNTIDEVTRTMQILAQILKEEINGES